MYRRYSLICVIVGSVFGACKAGAPQDECMKGHKRVACFTSVFAKNRHFGLNHTASQFPNVITLLRQAIPDDFGGTGA